MVNLQLFLSVRNVACIGSVPVRRAFSAFWPHANWNERKNRGSRGWWGERTKLIVRECLLHRLSGMWATEAKSKSRPRKLR